MIVFEIHAWIEEDPVQSVKEVHDVEVASKAVAGRRNTVRIMGATTLLTLLSRLIARSAHLRVKKLVTLQWYLINRADFELDR